MFTNEGYNFYNFLGRLRGYFGGLFAVFTIYLVPSCDKKTLYKRVRLNKWLYNNWKIRCDLKTHLKSFTLGIRRNMFEMVNYDTHVLYTYKMHIY